MDLPTATLNAMPFGGQKVQGRHHERLAVVYVRQSTVHQVQRHQESTQLQYGLVGHAERLGWPRERILVIDDDLGISGATAEGRQGFQRLLGEVALDHVGLILGVEMSRLARSCKDWYQLLELCALFGTLISDLDGLYDPSCYNDRLLLGLKGTMSEAELHILKQRMLQGARQKAQRGELVNRVPIGYVRDHLGHAMLDPDEQVQTMVRWIFGQFERIGTIAGVLRLMVRQEMLLPVRAYSGPDKGQLQWQRPNQTTLRNMLAYPMYAGAYVYGRSCQNKQTRLSKRCPRRLPPHQWQVLLRGRCPSYISWEQYELNVAQVAENRSRTTARGTVRRGRALLAGLVVCGRCGARMMTHYAGKTSQPRYSCDAGHICYGKSRCQNLAAQALDEEVVRLALLALTPSALEVSLQVTADVEKQRDETESHWQKRLERAEYEVERARRQYDAVEPENRLVARTLESSWEAKLRVQRTLIEQHDRFLQQQPKVLSAAEQEKVRHLATDLPVLWESDATIEADRKEILRQVIDKVVVRVEGDTEWMEAVVHWAGGHQTYTRLRRPVARLEQLSTWPAVRERVIALKSQGCRAPEIADQLNREGLRATNRRQFTSAGIRAILSRYGLTQIRRGWADRHTLLGPNEWLIPDLARHLGVAYQTIYGWLKRGRVTARQQHGSQGCWVVQADPPKLHDLTAYKRRRIRQEPNHECFVEEAKV
jgi:DNA invertase Pin-like site-specific DNA recombinase